MKDLNKIPLEVERKFIIKKPDVERLSEENGYTVSEITQIYLESESHITHRVRRRIYSDRTDYTETAKIRIDRISSYEDEKKITPEQFEALSLKMKTGTSPLHKTRHTFSLGGLTYEIDLYPAWKDTAIMEVELENRDVEIPIPHFIEIVEEVTGISEYSNAAMARNFPKEKDN